LDSPAFAKEAVQMPVITVCLSHDIAAVCMHNREVHVCLPFFCTLCGIN